VLFERDVEIARRLNDAGRRLRVANESETALQQARWTIDRAFHDYQTAAEERRQLAADIGEALGCGAHLAALRRTASGALHLDAAHTLESLAALDEASQAVTPRQALSPGAGPPQFALDQGPGQAPDEEALG
jgi:tRNA U55 pseudouridine synthase TruB